jgi:Transcriptional regulator, AbiEi antitoxin
LSAAEGTLSAVSKQLPPELRNAAERQSGVVTSTQAAAAGMTRNATRARVRTGRWQLLHRGVYATFSGQMSRLAELWAALLYAGPGAMLSHQTAAEMAGLADTPSRLVHVSVPADRRVSRAPGIVIHVSTRASARLHPARLPPQTRVEETVLDLVDQAGSLDDAVGWVTRALGRGFTTQDRLRVALAQRTRQRWRRELTELLSPDLAGLMSVLERRYQRDVERRHGLPAGTRQVRARREDRTEYRDVLYEQYATCVEVDGRLAHPGEQRWRDIRRDNAVAADGGVTLRYGWLDVTAWSCQTAAEVDRALRTRGFAGGRPCGPACPIAATVNARPQASPIPRLSADQRARSGQPRGSNRTRPGRGSSSRAARVQAASAAD